MADRDDTLHSFIGHVRRRWFVKALLRTLGAAAMVAAVPLVAGALTVRVLGLDGAALALTSAVSLLLALAGIIAVAFRIERRPDDRRVARFIEERLAEIPGAPIPDDGIVSAVESSASDSAAPFHSLVVAAALNKLSSSSPADIVTASVLRRAALRAACGSAVLLGALSLSAGPLLRTLETAWVAVFPESIHVEVMPGDARVVAGQPLRIRAVVRGVRGPLTRLAPSMTVSAGKESRTVPLAQDGDGFAFAFESIDRSFNYTIAAGAHRSRQYRVTALFPPRVKRIDVRYEYPSFAGLEPRDEQDAGDLYGPAGTRVHLRIHADKPVASGALALSGGTQAQPLRPAGDQTLEADLVLTKDDSYRLRLEDRDGLRTKGETEYFIRLMDDRPPDVRILRPGGDQQITPLEEVGIEARADDDYGVSSFELVYSVAGQREHVVPFSRTSGTTLSKIGAHLIAAEDLHVQPGDVVTYYARATDVGRGKRPTQTKSDIFFLEVRPFNEEFVEAQSQAMSGASDPQLEGLIAAQKEIINATWNIERRSGAGRSADDMKAVSQAQAELKARVEQMMASPGGRRPPFQAPQQQVAPFGQVRSRSSGGDSIGAAIQAMGRAVQQLDGQNTKDAIPHEMAALQGLLQAQAEVRRRQVMQQANGASGNGYGRQGQDLSALFDKELQRQQRTNYETRSQIEERPDQKNGDSALDRIRDLAKRQEDLSQRQRDLANAGLSAEELKRQLEKLTREQMELREQAEELARQLDAKGQQQSAASNPRQNESGGRQSQQPNQSDQQSGGQRQPGSTGQSSGASSGPMREASEQMRSAASDLRRQDPEAASASAGRAAEQLRRLEQQMRGGTPDARQRAAGELQLEAQQLADAQRRIASEVERLEKEGGNNADALRRVAGEKEGLADRVDALKKAADDLSKQAGARGNKDAGAAAAAGDAARELEREQIGKRMRDSAREMRDAGKAQAPTGAGQPSPSQSGRRASAEQQIARALDKAVEKLGGAAGTEARNLADQLDQSRDIRQRLDRLEQQIRDAEAKARAGRAGRDAVADAQGKQGDRGRQGSSGAGDGGELQRLRDEYARELQRARDTLAKLQQSQPRDGLGGSTPEEQEFSLSAPGTEAFKQDYSKWESLRKDVNLALERHDAAVSQRIAKKLAEDRLSAGGSDRVPDDYARLIARYYELLARTKK
jgi:hypothetical protein